MNKREFLERLRKGLHGLPQNDIEERLTFYGEMIDDGIEDGLSEEEAVSTVGLVEEVIAQAVADIPTVRTVKERIPPKKRLRAGEIVLLVLGSPIWLSLGIAAFAVILSLYVSLWAVIISLWAVFVSIAACSIGGILAFAAFSAGGMEIAGGAMLGASLVLAGLSIFAFFGYTATTKGILILSEKIAIRIKTCFIGKKVTQ